MTVTVSVASGYRVYTQGAVANGMFTLPAPVTARQLLARAGGATPGGGPGPRPHPAAGRAHRRRSLGLSRARETGEEGPVLEPGDVLAVPVREVTLGRVLVVGEVAQPHALPYREGMTILDAYLGAGGGTASADLRGVKIARQQPESGAVEVPVDLEAVLKRGALRHERRTRAGGHRDRAVPPPRPAMLVVGEVRTPKALIHREGLTLLDAFVEGGGGTDFADLDSTKVVRTGADGKRQEIAVDLARILKRADLGSNILLEPGDIVVVPR